MHTATDFAIDKLNGVAQKSIIRLRTCVNICCSLVPHVKLQMYAGYTP